MTFSLDGKTYGSEIAPFDKNGEYTVWFRLERKYADVVEGSFKVTVTGEKTSDGSQTSSGGSQTSSGEKGCGSNAGVAVSVLPLIIGFALSKRRKRA